MRGYWSNEYTRIGRHNRVVDAVRNPYTKTTSLGPVRAGLIGKGLIYAPAHGRVAFTVPGMSDFITRQVTD